MTDTSLPNQPSSAPADSYVDSYSPPNPASAAAGSSVAAPAAPSQSQPSTAPKTQQSAASDPLAELEKALQEYEAKHKQKAGEVQAVVQKTQGAVADADKKDPLAELERVLDEYEAKHKQKQGDQPSGRDTMSMDEFKQTLKNTDQPGKTAVPTPPSAAESASDSQAIEEQNIFELLGVVDAEETEKEAFLDELQQALWEDFLDKDLVQLVSAEQLAEIQTMRSKTDLPEAARQEQLIQKVEQLVPDVEEIMLEKALELKEDMVKERLAGMKEYYATRPAEMTKIQEAEKQILAGRWKSGAQLLNSLTA